MKSKIVGIIICIMLTTTFFSIATTDDTLNLQQTMEKSDIISFNTGVPTWEIGYWWDYNIRDLTMDLEKENQTIHLNLTTDALHLQVMDDTGDVYTLDYNAEISGVCDIDINRGGSPINVTLTLTPTPIYGNIVFKKSNLEIEELNTNIEGILWVKIWEQPFLELPFSIPVIPVPGEINLDADLDTAYRILDFPIFTGKLWNLTSTNITLNGELKSIWLWIIMWINKIAAILNNPFLPQEIADLLPVIDIKEALNVSGIGNIFSVPGIQYAFFCNNDTINITVGGETYLAYNISIIGGLGLFYYAPDAGNIIKMTGNYEAILPYVRDIEMELIDTNYQ